MLRSSIESTAIVALESLKFCGSANDIFDLTQGSDAKTVDSYESVGKPILTMEDFVEIEKAHYTFPERLMELLEGE